MPRMKLFSAGAPELVKSNQKDRFYTDHLTSLLSEVSRDVLPLRFWLKWQRELQLLAELGYYGITTICGNQTLGEEYCNIVQVAHTAVGKPFVAPGILRRTLPILIQTLGVYAIEKGLEVLYRRIRDRNLERLDISEQNYERLEKVVETVEDVFSGASRLHLAFFYLSGVFYHYGKRLLNVRYLTIRYADSQETSVASPMTTYRILGWMIIVQIVVKVIKWCYGQIKRKSHNSQTEHNEDSEEGGGKVVLEVEKVDGSGVRCPSCLEECQDAAASLCGHIFCWSCICEWTSEKAECPVCRTSVKPHQVVCLQHFQL